MKTRFRVVPISREVADDVRSTRKAPGYGHPAHEEIASGYGPCRSCLRTFVQGEESRILFTWNPFAGLESYPAPGPVFVHAGPCEAFEGDGFPDTLRTIPMKIEGYGRERWIVAREDAFGDSVEDAIERVLAQPAVRYAHVRNAEAGCFIAHVERA